jgi:hypothetical protein
MAEPPSKESDIPPPSTFTPPTIPTNLRVHFTTASRYGMEDANRLLQARQDHSIIHRDVPAEAQARYLPEHLYKMLPTSLRALCGRAMYEMASRDIETQKTGTNRVASNFAVATDQKLLPASSTQRLAKRSGRMIFSSSPQQDAVVARFMASVVTNICERIPVALSEIDSTLVEFITTTAERHARITSHRLPEVRMCPPSHDLPARAESTISVTYRGYSPDATSRVNQVTPSSLQVLPSTLGISLSQVTDGPVPSTPSAFSLPFPPRLPSVASMGFSHDVMQRAIRILHWMQSHVHGKVFATEKDFNRFVSHLIQISCSAAASRQEDDEYPDIPRGDKFFTIQTSDKNYRYRIIARKPVQEDFSGALPGIVLPESRGCLLRVLERFDTIFLATGHLEAGWQAACHRADFELEMEEEEPIGERTCVCLFEHRPHTVHRCHECFRRLMCESQYQSTEDNYIFTPLCVDCRKLGRSGPLWPHMFWA